MPRLAIVTALALGLMTALPGAAGGAPPANSGPPIVMPPGSVPGNPPVAAAPRGCLATGNGYLRARIRGALNVDIDWHNGELECDGGPRPDGSGIRVSFEGPKRPDGHRLRLVFGVNAVREGRAARDLPTNLTVIVEGARRLYTTGGEDHCTVDSLHQQRLPTPGTKPRTWRIVARGFCVGPASTLNNAEHILVSSFDFSGSAVYGDDAVR